MEYATQISWQRGDKEFTTKSYSRDHHISFNNGLSLAASSAPEFSGNVDLANPEELFTAAISSCFMLTFLYWAAMKNLIIDSYTATATGILAKNTDGKMAITEVIIKPTIFFHNNQQPDSSLLKELFHKAHENCFISNSVKSKVTIDQQ